MNVATTGRRSASVVLALLFVAYILNYLDRQILGILAKAIETDLDLNDRQFGALSGWPFAILYSFLGIPFAFLADRTSRSRVVAAAVAFWSAFTALCGTATSLRAAVRFRMGVGIGEAGGVAPSYALIADYFEPRRRARALAIFSLGVPVGLSLALVMGAYIAHAFSWRAVFFTMGVAGLVLAPIMLLVVRDPPRTFIGRCADRRGVPDAGAQARLLDDGLRSLVQFALRLWSRDRDSVGARTKLRHGPDRTRPVPASVVFIGGCTGVWPAAGSPTGSGTLDRGWYAKLPAIAWLITAPTFAAGLLAPTCGSLGRCC